MKVLRYIILGVVACGILLFLMSATSRWRLSLDVAAGRQREETWTLGLEVSDKIEDTALTRVYRQVVGPPPPPEWGTDNEYSGLVRIEAVWPCHGGVSSAEWLGGSLEEGSFTDEAKRAAVLGFLELTRHSQAAALDYEDRIEELAHIAQTTGAGPVGAEDLPDPADVRRLWQR